VQYCTVLYKTVWRMASFLYFTALGSSVSCLYQKSTSILRIATTITVLLQYYYSMTVLQCVAYKNVRSPCSLNGTYHSKLQTPGFLVTVA